MSSALSAAERAAIDAYAGAVQRIPNGQSSYGYVWCDRQKQLVSTRKLPFNRWDGKRNTLATRNQRQKEAKARRFGTVIDLLSKGVSQREIARRVGISPRTVREYQREAEGQ